ncbi:hypothetical protein C2G38_2130938 [Gigaspora rosea]|uniref:FAD binding domain-containing protein n=1 Tax=Gigaspora rosea TaxID=44941 RepID=A0A397W9S0_9GLOM|nr:hypothetical protein C2G38_2130938 [Gigaspora rosea]
MIAGEAKNEKTKKYKKRQSKPTSGRSARDLAHPDLIKEKFKLDLSLVSRLGGHSQPRAHRGKEMFPGMTITYALMEGIEEIVNNQPGSSRRHLTKLCKEYGPVILATGGYAADFTENPLLKKYRPDIYNLLTTNIEGDGHKMDISIGGKATHMEKVQVHPTGLVDLKTLGCRWLLLNDEGKRFCDKLGHSDYVTGEIWKTKLSKEIEWHFKHYVRRGLIRKFSDEALAKEIGISASQLKATFDDYTVTTLLLTKRRILLARKFFHNVPITINDQFHVAFMSPVLHYIMVRDMQEQVIPGLFASGEIAVVFMMLTGSSLLGCVVYGRVAGDSASRYLFQNLSSATANCRLGQIARQLAPYQTIVSVDLTNQKAPVPEKKADAPTRDKKEYTVEEVAKHNKENDCLVIVNDEVLNVTNFLPGKSS